MLATIIILLVAVVGMNAQVALTSSGTASAVKTDAGESPEYVTINSVMPYQVPSTDWGNLSSQIFSAYGWTVTAGGELYKRNGNALVDVTGNAGFYTDNQINIRWTALGDQTVSVTEKSIITATNAAGCSGAAETLPVKVLPWPTVAWGTITNPSGCNVASVSLPLTLKGSQSITVYYDVYYTSLTAAETKVNGATPLEQVFTNSGYDVAVTTPNLSYTLANGAGAYRIQIVNIRDKVTEKSFGGLGQTDAARNAVASAMPADYTFYSYPTPTTQPIQHITNL